MRRHTNTHTHTLDPQMPRIHAYAMHIIIIIIIAHDDGDLTAAIHAADSRTSCDPGIAQ